MSDVLLIHNTENERYKLNITSINLVSFCQQIVEDIQAIAQDGLIIKFNYQDNNYPSQWDERLLRQILTNLLSNAIKYSPEESIVYLELFQKTSNYISHHRFGNRYSYRKSTQVI